MSENRKTAKEKMVKLAARAARRVIGEVENTIDGPPYCSAFLYQPKRPVKQSADKRK